jgi:single-strand DNA-binding protein
MCNLRLATTDRYKDKQGEQHEQTEWHTVTIWIPSMIRLCEEYVRKGSKVYVEGKLTHRKYQDKNGQDRTATSVQIRPFSGYLILLDGPGKGTSAPERRQKEQREVSINDDDIPF